MANVALLSCCAYLVVSIGRIGELVPQLAEAPLAKIAIGSALVGLFASYGEQLRHPILSTRIGKIGACLLALSIISVLFSVWRSNSLAIIRDNALVLAVSYALIVKCATQLARYRSAAESARDCGRSTRNRRAVRVRRRQG